MKRTMTGVVMSTQLAHFGSGEITYGFVTVEADDRRLVQVKIDAYTDCESFDVGDRVDLEVAPLGQTEILVVRRIHRIESALQSATEVSIVEPATA